MVIPEPPDLNRMASATPGALSIGGRWIRGIVKVTVYRKLLSQYCHANVSLWIHLYCFQLHRTWVNSSRGSSPPHTHNTSTIHFNVKCYCFLTEISISIYDLLTNRFSIMTICSVMRETCCKQSWVLNDWWRSGRVVNGVGRVILCVCVCVCGFIYTTNIDPKNKSNGKRGFYQWKNKGNLKIDRSNVIIW